MQKTIKVENLLIKAENSIKRFFRILANNKLKIFLIILGVLAFSGTIFATGGGGFFKIGSPASVAAKGLVGYWPLDSASMKNASTTADLTPNANDGTLYGRALANRLTTDRKNVANGAMSFDGTNDYVGTPTIGVGTGAFTMSLWAKIPSLPSPHDALIGGESGYAGLLINGGGGFSVGKSAVTPGTLVAYSIPFGEWIHIVAVVKTNTTADIYVNGKFIGTSTEVNVYTLNNRLFNIGCGFSTADIPYTGLIDDVRIYNYALSQSEITKLYDDYKPKIVIDSLNKGLVGYWPLDSKGMKSATVAADLTPYGNDGTVSGAVLTTDRKQVANAAMSFDGTNDYVSIPDSSSWQLGGGPGDFTIELWANLDTLSQDNWWTSAFIAQDEGGGGTNKWIFAWDASTDKLTFHVNTPAGSPNFQISSNSFSAAIATWYHIILKRSGDTYTFYKNGAAIGSTVQTGTIPNAATPLTIGWGEGTGSFDGLIDEVRIYNRALSQAEITRLYNSYKPKIVINSLEKGLVGHWPLDSASMKSATVTADLTPQGNDGTLYGRALANRLTTDRKNVANGAMSFDGVNDYVSVPPISISNNITIEAWVYSDNFNRLMMIALKKPVNTQWQFFFDAASGGLGSYRVSLMGGSTTRIDTWLDSSYDNKWHHAVATISGTTGTIYIDGILKVTGVVTAIGNNNVAGTNDVLISTYDGVNYPFNGKIDDVRIYNRALSADEVRMLYERY